MWFWQYSFTMQQIRYDVFYSAYVPDVDDPVEEWKEKEWCYVRRHKDAPQNHEIGAADVTVPFQEYPTMRRALQALGWEGQRLTWWLHVPPFVQDDWSDLTQEELLEKGAPSPIITALEEGEEEEEGEGEGEGLYDKNDPYYHGNEEAIRVMPTIDPYAFSG